MTPTPIESAADYLLLDDANIAPNEAGEWIKAAYEATVGSYQRLRRCWAGAYLAQLFAQRPWLDAARLALTVSFEYGDDGSYFRTVRCNAAQVQFVENCDLPEAEFPDGKPDPDAAAASLENDVENYEFELYDDLRGGQYSDEDLVLTLRRAPIASLLLARPLSGALAVKAWELDRLD